MKSSHTFMLPLIVGLLLLIIFQISSDAQNKNTGTDSNPYLPEQHIPDKTGYMHPLPCHEGETAVVQWGEVVVGKVKEYKLKEKEGCYDRFIQLT